MEHTDDVQVDIQMHCLVPAVIIMYSAATPSEPQIAGISVGKM